jgi:WD40 repeat protein/tRNA A-37 threonylcarbamoyl transferase component Bud32
MTDARDCPVCGSPIAPGKTCPTCVGEPDAGATLADDRATLVLRPVDEATADAETAAGGNEPTLRAEPSSGPKAERVRTRPFGDYLLFEEIGRGGMGVIFKARHFGLNRVVALKMILAGRLATEAERRRFQVEAEAAGALEHPNIVPIYEVGERAGRPYFTMRFIEGGNLAQRVEAYRGRPEAAARLIVTVARAVHHAHQRGILHRDLKPANILLDAAGEPMITDFGLAKRVEGESGLTHTGAILGTPSYMAPEQAGGQKQPLTTAVDVYALGAIFYELLTGTPPFKGETPLETVRMVVEREPPRPRSAAGVKIDRDLETVCMKCLEKDPRQRYGSAEELARDLEHWLAGEPVRARPTTAAERALKWARRHPAVATLAAVSATVVLVALVGGAWFTTRLSDAVARAEAASKNARNESAAAQKARQAAEETLADMHTASGVEADRRGEPAQALLWFANAARIARGDSAREWANRVRTRTWSRRSAIPTHAFRVTDQPPAELSFHPDGRDLLVIDGQGRAVIWNLGLDRPLDWLGTEPVAAAKFSPDGRWLVIGRPNGAIEVRLAGGGTLLESLKVGGTIRALAFSPDSRYLAAAGDTVRILDCRTQPFAVTDVTDSPGARTLAFSPRGDRLAIGADGDRARVFDIRASRQARFDPVVHMASAGLAPMFIGDGGRLLTVTGRDEVTLWDAGSGQSVRKFNQRYVDAMAASPDGRLFALAGWMGAQVWEVASGQAVGPGHPSRNWIRTVKFNPDGGSIAVGGSDRTSRMFPVQAGRMSDVVIAHQGEVARVSFSPDGRSLATAQIDGLVRVWCLPSDDPRDARLEVGVGPLAVRLSGDGRVAIAAAEGIWGTELRRTRAFDLETGRPTGPMLELEGRLRDAALSNDGRHAAVLSVADEPFWDGRAGSLELWDVVRGARRADPVALPSEPWSVGYSPDGGRVAALCAAGEVVVVDAATGQVAFRLQHGPGPAFRYDRFVGYSPEGRRLVTIGPDSTVMVWDAETGKPVHGPLKIGGGGWRGEFSHDGRYFATGSTENVMRVWDLAAGREACRALAHPDWAFRGVFSHDERLLLTACRDGQARLWDWRAGRLVCPPFTHDDEVYSVAWAADDRWVFTGGRDGIVRAWDWKTGKPVTPKRFAEPSVSTVDIGNQGRCALAGINGGTALESFSLDDLIAPGTPALDDLVIFGELVAGQRTYQADLAGLTTAEWLNRWDDYRHRHPEPWVNGRGESVARHRHEAERAEALGFWSSALAHLDAWLAAEPGRADLLVRRGRAAAMLGHWSHAQEDFDAAMQQRTDPLPLEVNGGWWLAGPYHGTLHAEYPPESSTDPARPIAAGGAGTSSRWTPAAVGPDGRIDFLSLFGHTDNMAVYAMARVYTTGPRTVALLCGSDDSVRIWLNDHLVIESENDRTAAPDQDCALVTLRPGLNTLLAKVVNDHGEHGLYLRLSDAPADLVRAHIDSGDWGGAVDGLAAMVATRPDDVRRRYQHALSLALKGDRSRYRAAVSAALAKFSGTTSPDAAFELARACSLEPGAVDDPAAVVKLAELSLSADPRRGWRLYELGLALHRAGKHEEAIKRLHKALEADPTWQANALLRPALALAHHGAGHVAEAKRWLAGAGDNDADDGNAPSLPGTVSREAPWWDRAEFELLEREAKALLSAPRSTQSPP